MAEPVPPGPGLARRRLAATVGLDLAGRTGAAADAALVAAGADCTGLFAGRPPGPAVRAVPVDDASKSFLRFPRPPVPAVHVGEVQSWSTAELGDAAVATVRCICAVPGGVALGSDYGLTLWRNGRAEPFPWPAGARREARRVEAMTMHRGALVVGTQQSLVTWELRGEATLRRHARDDDEGWDDLRSLLSTGDRLLLGWRTHLDGGAGPPETLSLTEAPGGVVYAGTLDGELHVVDGGGPIRRFADHKGRPIRHLAFADGAVWAAAHGALHRFDGAAWTSHGPEPTALTTDAWGRLWAVVEGRLHAGDGEGLRPVDVPLERPWALCAVPSALWVGGRDRVWRVALGRG